jgi:hypothetical protein
MLLMCSMWRHCFMAALGQEHCLRRLHSVLAPELFNLSRSRVAPVHDAPPEEVFCAVPPVAYVGL